MDHLWFCGSETRREAELAIPTQSSSLYTHGKILSYVGFRKAVRVHGRHDRGLWHDHAKNMPSRILRRRDRNASWNITAYLTNSQKKQFACWPASLLRST